MDLDFEPCAPDAGEDLVAWIAAEEWPFHGTARPAPAEVRRRVAAGRFGGEDAQSFWIVGQGGERVGLLALQELTDPTPVFDLRLKAAWRGQGLGRQAVRWLAEHTFTRLDKHRVEAHTRRDNLPMRHVLRACGWVKEAHYRRAWPDAEGTWHDAVAYALLREDWERGTRTPVPWDEEP